MSTRSLAALWVALTLLALTWLFPPMTSRPRFPADGFRSEQFRQSLGPRFLFSEGHYNDALVFLEIEYPKILLLDAVIVAAAIGVISTFCLRTK